jgi:DNA polymerase III sliding clamp (beta) subunit (PCNA family)
MFEAVFAQTALLKKIVDAIRELNETVSFDISSTGISLQVSPHVVYDC